ncbi:MAG: hypothetical protein RJB66_1151 [Pseudomonadota bacterium]|jgi:hypothetical protein
MFQIKRPPHFSNLKRRLPHWGRPNKAVFYFIGSTFFLNTLILSPFIYFTNQNFNFFQNLAIDTSPTLLTHLEREQTWFNIIAIALLFAINISNWRFAMKLLRNYKGQIFALDRHLKHLIRGEWFVPPLRVRRTDDFKEVVEQYGYFYKSIQAITKAEIQILEQMKIDPSERDSFLLWRTLLNQKKARLGFEDIGRENARAAELGVHWKKAL